MRAASGRRAWRRSWQDRGLRLLFWAVTVAVAALSSVALFSDRVERALVRQGAALMAADLVVEQGRPTPPEWRQQATRLGLKTARSIGFPTVIIANQRPLLVQVKAVEPGYPLRGRLQVRDADGTLIGQPPPAGSAWLEGRLRDRLQLRIGQDSLQLGGLQLAAAGLLVDEPDRGGNLFQLAPRLMVGYQDVQRSGLLGPASRVKHYLSFAGDAASIARMRAWLAARLPTGSTLLGLEDARPELRTALERARRFLSLAALCASLLAGIAILLATRRYVDRSLDGAAVLRTLGMSARAVLGWHLRRLLAVAATAILAGTLAGFAGQQALAALLGDWFDQALPLPGLRPLLVGVGYGAGLVLGFSVPSLLDVGRVPPLRVLRRELAAPGLAGWLVWGVALAVFFGLMVWQVQELKLAAAMALALTVAVALLMAVGRLLLWSLRPLRRAGSTAALGLAALAREPRLTLLQLAGFGLGTLLLLLLAVVRVDIIDSWQDSLAEDAPNHFLINVQPGQVDALRRLYRQRQLPNSGLYPTTRGRLVAINDRELVPESYRDPRARRLAAREYSLGFGARMQRDNRIAAGRWWDEREAGRPGFSVEVGMARSLGIGVGDRLRFDVAGQRVDGPVTSLREVAWDSFNVNFFVVGTPALQQGLPVAYLSSLYIDDDGLQGQSAPSQALALELAERFPAVSLIDLRPILSQVRAIMARGALAVETVFAFTLVAAALVTLAAAQVSRDQRAREVAIMRTLGMSRRRLRRVLLVEFGLLGLLGGLAASLLASISGYLIATELFGLPGRLSPTLWLAGVGGGTLVVMLVGWLATRRLLAVAPVRVLSAL